MLIKKKTRIYATPAVNGLRVPFKWETLLRLRSWYMRETSPCLRSPGHAASFNGQGDGPRGGPSKPPQSRAASPAPPPSPKGSNPDASTTPGGGRAGVVDARPSPTRSCAIIYDRSNSGFSEWVGSVVAHHRRHWHGILWSLHRSRWRSVTLWTPVRLESVFLTTFLAQKAKSFAERILHRSANQLLRAVLTSTDVKPTMKQRFWEDILQDWITHFNRVAQLM